MWRTNRAPSQLPGIPSKPPTPAEPAADDLEDYTEYTADYPTPANNSLPFNPLSAAYNFRMFGQTGGVGANFPPDAVSLSPRPRPFPKCQDADLAHAQSTLRAYATATAPTIFSSSRADPTDSSNSSQSLSNSIALNKLKLDSHTAKLKEQLLSKRRELPDKAVTPPAQSEAGTTTFVPHSMPQEISKNHMPASDNDIAALIADIGASTATSPSETRKMDTGQLRRESTSTIKTANTPRQTSYGEPRDIKYPKSGTNGQQRTSNHSHIQAMPAAAQLPRPAAAGPSDIVEEGEIVGSPMEVDNVAEPVSISMPRPRKPMADTEKVSGPAEKGSGSGSTEKRPTLTERQAVSTEKRFASVDKRATTLPERRPSLDTTQQTPQKQPKPTGAAQANHTEGDKDLQDWLIFTNWHDLEYRTQFLSRRRKIRALEAEKQALLEQEEAESASRRQFSAARGPLSAAAVTPVRSALAISQPDNKAVPNTPTMDVEMEPRQPASTKTIPAKRELEEEEKPAVTEKYTRVDDSKGYSRARASSRGRSLSPQKSPPRKDSHGYWNERSPEQRLPRTTSYYDNKYSGDNDGARRYDNYRSNRDGPGPSLSYRGGYRPNSSYRNRPKLELGRKGGKSYLPIFTTLLSQRLGQSSLHLSLCPTTVLSLLSSYLHPIAGHDHTCSPF